MAASSTSPRGLSDMYRRILVAVDGSSTADAALREALDLAWDAHARVRIVRVMDSEPR